MGYVPTANKQSIEATRDILTVLPEDCGELDYAIELRIMEHCFPEEYAEEMRKQKESE